MRCPRGAEALATIGLSTLLAIPSPAASARVLGVRHGSSPERTRVVVDLDVPAAHRHQVVANPPGVIVDIDGASGADALRDIPIADGVVVAARPVVHAGGVRLVLDLVEPRSVRVFSLDADTSRPYRIVIDVSRAMGPVRPDEITASRSGPPVVVLDPGHGGVDPGATAPGLLEKDVAFRAALAIKEAIASRDPHVVVVLTRDGDRFVSLRDRYRLAEARGADLFVSIHANAARNAGAGGAEVFFLTLGEATDTEARRVAELENAADLRGGENDEAGEALVQILADLQMKSTLHRSSLVAASILDGLAKQKLMRTRAVRQAPFVVLQSARVPSVLVEIGFLSNPQEARLLRQEDFLDRFARSVGEGILGYLERLERAPGT